MSIITNQIGDELLAYRPGGEGTELEGYPGLPLVFSCVVARHRGETLFVYNVWRKLWELPAGLIEPDETPMAAGIRELQEESGQVVPALTYAGLALVRSGRSGQLELGTMFTCELKTLQHFQSDGETSAIMRWDLKREVKGQVDALSCKLVELVLAG
jgi:8-oxo-dGTP diphosphatase